MEQEKPIEVGKIVETVKETLGAARSGPSETMLKAAETPLPSTEQISSGLAQGEQLTREAGKGPLSATGKAVMGEVQETLGATRELLQQKNRDETMQKAAGHVQCALKLLASNEGRAALAKAFPKDPEAQKASLEEQVKELANLGRLLVTSTEFREMLAEGAGWLQECFSPEGKELSFSEAVQSSLETKQLPELSAEQKDRLWERLQKLLARLKQKEEFQRALGSVVERVSVFAEGEQGPFLEDVFKQLTVEEKTVLEQVREEVRLAGEETGSLVEHFADCSLDGLKNAKKELLEAVSKDESLQGSLRRLASVVQKGFQEVDQAELREELEQSVTELRAKGEALQGRLQRLFLELSHIAQCIREDRLGRRLGESVSSLGQHLFFSPQGTPTLKTELLTDLQSALPRIMEKLRWLKVPDVEISEPGLAFVARDIVLDARALTPRHIRLALESDIAKDSLEASALKGTRNSVTLEMTGISAEAQGIRFAVDKTSLPPLTDTGLADLRIDDMSIFVLMEPVFAMASGQSEGAAGLQVLKAECVIDQLDLHVRGSGRDWMYYLLGPLLRRLVRQKMEASIADYLRQADLWAALPA